MKRKQIVCPICKKVFEVWPSVKRIYCSRKCVGKATALRYARDRVTTLCEVCGKQIVHRPRREHVRFCSRACANPAVSRESAEKRGNKRRGTGKGLTYIKYRSRHLHRVLAEKKLGRPLKKGEVVHHVNGNRRDNRLENLVVITQSIHARIHFTKNRKCSIPGCGRKHAAKGYCEKHWRQWRKGKLDFRAAIQEIETGAMLEKGNKLESKPGHVEAGNIKKTKPPRTTAQRSAAGRKAFETRKRNEARRKQELAS